MVVIWGLDLKEMQWWKFKGSYMWGNTYFQRRRRFVVYQLAMILCVVSESLGTDALSNYQKAQYRMRSTENGRFVVHSVVGAYSYNIFVGVYVATIFGAAFFFDLFWPERREIYGVRVAWRICSVLACCFALSSALLLTVLISTRSDMLPGGKGGTGVRPPLQYRRFGENLASVILIWLGWLATIWSTYLMWKNIAHQKLHGPFSAHVQRQKDIENLASEPQPLGHLRGGTPEEEATRIADEKRSADESEDDDALSNGLQHDVQTPLEEYTIPTPELPTPSLGLDVGNVSGINASGPSQLHPHLSSPPQAYVSHTAAWSAIHDTANSDDERGWGASQTARGV